MTHNIHQNQNSSSEELELISKDPVVVRMRMAIVQVLVWFFIYIDIFMLFTFFSKQALRCDTRYILFAHILLVDSIFLLLTDVLVLFGYFYVLMPLSSCIILCIIMEAVTYCTPLTITAMCLERYVAICMPLRHADISSPGRTVTAVIIISAYSSVSSFLDLFILIATAPPGYFAKLSFCHYEIMMVTQWHRYIRAIRGQVELVVIVIIILFCYVKIMLAAKAASGENKQSVSKGRRTLLLHGLQLFLCVIDKWCPFIEVVVMEHNLQLYLTIRYFNFVAFTIISKALSSLIYGLRDKIFFHAVMYYTTCKLNRISLET